MTKVNEDSDAISEPLLNKNDAGSTDKSSAPEISYDSKILLPLTGRNINKAVGRF